jgi:hydroxylaminobenzene mutase
MLKYKPIKEYKMENSFLRKRHSDRLIFFGILLFMVGLIIGFFVPLFANPRMGLSSHIEGILNGIFLVVLGLIWHKIEVSDLLLKITYGMALYGTFANCLGMLIAAVFNAGKSLTVAANGHEGAPIVEGFITFILIFIVPFYDVYLCHYFNWTVQI